MIDKIQEDMRTSMYNEEYGEFWGNALIAMAIIGFTAVFTVKYLKRMITITFLILLAPVTCITYPIDKVKDGKAQAFDYWLREFIFEVMIQPFHLLLYVVLISSASTLASQNIIYSILCFAIMLPAEKVIKEMFGINEKLGSPLNAALAGAGASQLMNMAKSLGDKKATSDSNDKSSSSKNDEYDDTPRTKPDSGAYSGESDMGDDNSPGSGSDEDNNEDIRTTPFGGDDSPGNGGDDSQSNGGSDNPDNGGGSGGNDSSPNEDTNDQSQTDGVENSMLEENPSSNSGSDDDWDDFSNFPTQDDEENQQDSNQDSGDNSSDGQDRSQNNNTNNANQQKKPSKMSQLYNKAKNTRLAKYARNSRRAMAEEYNARLRKKYGTDNKLGAAGIFAFRGAKKLVGKTFRMAVKTALGGALALGAGAAMLFTGDPKKIMGAAAGAFAYGASKGGRIADRVSNRAGKVGDYIKIGDRAAKSDKRKEREFRNRFYNNDTERKEALKAFKERNNGRMPSTREMKEEMDRRYKYKKMGIDDSKTISKAIALEEKENQRLDTVADVDKKMNDDTYRSNYNNLMETGDKEKFDKIYGDGAADNAYRYRQYEKLKAYDDILNNNGSIDDFKDKYGEEALEQTARAYKNNTHPLTSWDSYRDSATSKQRANIPEKIAYAANMNENLGYKGSDFLDEKKMSQALKGFEETYMEENKGASKAEARRAGIEQLRIAARLKGVQNPNIPGLNNSGQRGNRQQAAPSGNGQRRQAGSSRQTTQGPDSTSRTRRTPRSVVSTNVGDISHIAERLNGSDKEYEKFYNALNGVNSAGEKISESDFDSKYGDGAAEKAKEHYQLEQEMKRDNKAIENVNKNLNTGSDENKDSYKNMYEDIDKGTIHEDESNKEKIDDYKRYKQTGKRKEKYSDITEYAREKAQRELDTYYGGIMAIHNKVENNDKLKDDIDSLGKKDGLTESAFRLSHEGVSTQKARNYIDMQKKFKDQKKKDPNLRFEDYVLARRRKALRNQGFTPRQIQDKLDDDFIKPN